MERALILEKLTIIFRKIFNDETILLRDELTAGNIANWDSLSHMIMIGEVETVFSVKFKLKELSKLTDVKDLMALIVLKLE